MMPVMLIGIEASRANRLQKTGVEWYAHNLIQAMKTLPEAVDHSWLLYGNDPLASGLERGPSNWHPLHLRWPPLYLWTQIRLTWEMFRRPPDVLFVPAHVLPRAAPPRSVVTIHDIGFHRYPELYKPIQRVYHEWSTKDIIRRASRIITISEFSKREIVECYGADPEQIVVIPLGIDQGRYQPMEMRIVEPILDKLQLTAPFIMYVGRIEKKKNVKTLVEGFTRYKIAAGADDTLELVLVGQRGVGAEEVDAAIAESVAREQIKWIGYASEEEKIALLSAAEALVHPSFYEGFGLTPLEAMACGCPVISSIAASLREVLGEENALWFDPKDPQALSETLLAFIGDQGQREAMRARGLAWVKHFTWEATARQTFRALTQR